MSTHEEGYRDRTRERLLAVAEALVTETGLDALQARRVAREADCSIGTLYNIFGDIHGLIIETNARTLKILGSIMTAASQRSTKENLEARLNTLAVTYLDFASANQNRWRAVFEHRLPVDKPIPERFGEDRRQLLAMIETQLADTIDDPEKRSDTAYALFGAVHGIVLLSLDAKLGTFEPTQCARRIRLLVAHAVAGIQATK
ncbi:MAG: TetR/AcrR family transcriptional regulator [Pseudomonadota bacterium]